MTTSASRIFKSSIFQRTFDLNWIDKNKNEINVCLFRESIEYVVGSSGRIVIDMDLVNNGEDAYDALAHLTWSPADAFTYIKAVGDKNLDVTCSPITSS